MKTLIFDEIDSTNNYAKTLPDGKEDVVIVAKRQTGGRGSKGRSFISETGGIYLSFLRFDAVKTENAFSIMANAAVAVVKTLAAFGIDGGIKWPNDVFVGGKKICGILIENVFSGDTVHRSVTGIGLNVNNPIAAEIGDIAVSMKEISGKEFPLKDVLATLVYNLTLPTDMEYYAEKSIILGKEITVVKDGAEYSAVADEILGDGRLKLRSGEILSAAEVTIK